MPGPVDYHQLAEAMRAGMLTVNQAHELAGLPILTAQTPSGSWLADPAGANKLSLAGMHDALDAFGLATKAAAKQMQSLQSALSRTGPATFQFTKDLQWIETGEEGDNPTIEEEIELDAIIREIYA